MKLYRAIIETAPPFANTFLQPLRPSLASSNESNFFSSSFHFVAKDPITKNDRRAINQVQ